MVSISVLDPSESYTYADYFKWDFDERVELIDGRVFAMRAPNRVHQEISMAISVRLGNFLKGKPVKIYFAPFDVRLPRSNSSKDSETFTVVQPDICVICDLSKLDDRGCIGAPDIIVEILSPGNNKKELRNKYDVYQESGVKEYWVIHPSERTFLKYTLGDDGLFSASRLFVSGDELTTEILPGFVLELSEIFEED